MRPGIKTQTAHDSDILFNGQYTKTSAFRGLLSYLPEMPKAPASLPLSGLFGIVKPSGPTSMDVVDKLKKLVCHSRLFVDEEKLKKKGGKKRARKGNVKVGQGGTLDPLADGVLGECV
jgi:tRNA U55 pseudouridine synthase TruB